MNLRLTEEQELLQRTFEELFAAESGPARVRAAEPLGFDPGLWKTLVETGAPGLRVPEARGGSGAGLLEAVLLADRAGRHLASAPLVESLAACGLLARFADGAGPAREALRGALEGSALATLALREIPPAARGGGGGGGEAQLVPGAAVADFVVGLDGEELVLRATGALAPALANLASSPVARVRLDEPEGRSVLARGAPARRAFLAAREEWKLLTAAALGGLARRALEIAADYASERIQFDRPIGAFQAIAHPLADDVTAVEGGQELVRRAVWAIARGRPEAGALVSLAFAWAARAASEAVAHALHTHGGYGLSLENDIQLYHRRGKAWALLAGNPRDEFLRAAARLWDGEAAALPDAGPVALEFGLGEDAEALRREVQRFLAEHLTEELRAHAHPSWAGHHPGFQRQLAEAGLLFPSWPREYGGRERNPYEVSVVSEELERVGWTGHAIGTTRLVAETLMRFGSDALKREVLPRIARGEAVCSLGYTEPGSGSDVAAARTRAVRDGDAWVINGQKMFTSGADVSQYIFLLTRTDPEARKHRGLTMFLVPVETQGIEVQAIQTLSDERTNATYYTDVRVPDRYRVGPAHGGWEVVGYALALEHAGAGGAFGHDHEQLIRATVDWARAARRDGRPAWEDPRVRERLGEAAARAEVARALALRSFWCQVEGEPDRGRGPMVKLFGAEAFIRDAADLMDLAAPDSILSAGAGAAAPGGAVEYAYRLSTATSIYGGTSEIMRSIVAQDALGLPRSRS